MDEIKEDTPLWILENYPEYAFKHYTVPIALISRNKAVYYFAIRGPTSYPVHAAFDNIYLRDGECIRKGAYLFIVFIHLFI